MRGRQGIGGDGSPDQLRDLPATHVFVGVVVCLFVLSPALFTPWGFGPDFSNHLWLIWQQGLAISHAGHPTLFLQTPGGIFEPFFGFYGGTLYAVVGAASAILGDRPYPVYIASIGLATALAYGGMWWLGRQLALSRPVAHLPAIVFVTGAYFLTDVYARGAWPEFVALSAVPMFLAAGARLLSGPWQAGPVALFVLASVLITGSHNITLFWGVVVIGPIAVLAWYTAGRVRPSLTAVAKVVALALLAVGINAWFLGLDLTHSGDTMVGANPHINWAFTQYFDTLGVVLNPVRSTPAESDTYGLTISAPVGALALSVVIVGLAWREGRRVERWLRSMWLILLAAMVVLIWMMVMPGSWWRALGSPFILIQFPYRLAGWLLLAIAVQLAVSLRLAQTLKGRRRLVVAGLAFVLLITTIIQASAQMYSGGRLDGSANGTAHVRQTAFANGPAKPPATYYDAHSYADASLPVIKTMPSRVILLPEPPLGGTHLSATVPLPPGHQPIATNIAAGPYVASVGGLKVIGRTAGGGIVLKPPHGVKSAHLEITADGGTQQMIAVIVSISCILGFFGLLLMLSISGLRYRRGPIRGRR